MASTCCHHDHCSAPEPGEVDPGWRSALWIALGVNVGMFLIEITAGVAAGSASLQADALDFAGDAGNYAISLGVAGMALAWRARAALAKGLSLAVLAAWVIATAIWHAIAGTLPSAETMGVVGVMALAANAWVAVMLYRYRSGDATCGRSGFVHRNDAIGNVAVVLAAARGVRHRYGLAGHVRGLRHGRARHVWGLADRAAGYGGVARGAAPTWLCPRIWPTRAEQILAHLPLLTVLAERRPGQDGQRRGSVFLLIPWRPCAAPWCGGTDRSPRPW